MTVDVGQVRKIGTLTTGDMEKVKVLFEELFFSKHQPPFYALLTKKQGFFVILSHGKFYHFREYVFA